MKAKITLIKSNKKRAALVTLGLLVMLAALGVSSLFTVKADTLVNLSGGWQISYNDTSATIYKYTGIDANPTIPTSYTPIGVGTYARPVTGVAANAFKDNSSITSITIPDCIYSVGQNAFEGCTGLTSATISSNVHYISGYMF